ncbi:fimbrillin family protein [Bacteroides sp. CR5/BHMF/2]|nr:fimbrillin family protein [Bacteroides sp. CR5/BHMF/2]
MAYAGLQNINGGHKDISFSMTQACSWLVIDFKRGNTKDDITLSEFSLINSGLYKEYLLNVTDGSTAGTTAADAGTITFTGDIALAKNSTVTRNLSMPPLPSLVGGLKVSMKVKEYGGKVLSTTLGNHRTGPRHEIQNNAHRGRHGPGGYLRRGASVDGKYRE